MLSLLTDAILWSWLTGSWVVGTLIALALVTLWHLVRGKQ